MPFFEWIHTQLGSLLCRTCVELELQLPHSCLHIICWVEEHQYTVILLVPIPSKFRVCSLAASPWLRNYWIYMKDLQSKQGNNHTRTNVLDVFKSVVSILDFRLPRDAALKNARWKTQGRMPFNKLNQNREWGWQDYLKILSVLT